MTSPNSRSLRSRVLFDKRDHALLEIVNGVLNKNAADRDSQRIFHPYFHPHGIKELTESKGLRIAYSVVQLLYSLEEGKVDERLNALRSLKEEVVNTAEGPMPKNTARVLLQIMKELVRAHGDYRRQLKLAHDFRTTASGKPRLVREQLRRYHLLEMPEQWNQVSFDDHVHDVHTKGRKSPTHLIMDAWIKGIRRLRVIYYNFMQPHSAAELLEAAGLMEIQVRIGIEFSARFRGRFAQLIWVPRGFADTQAFLAFLAEPNVAGLMVEGQKVSQYQQRFIFAVLAEFNRRHLSVVNDRYGLELAPLDEAAFLAFVGAGQASMLHLAKFIHLHILNAMGPRVEVLRKRHGEARTEEERLAIAGLVEEMNRLDEDAVVDRFLQPSQNPSVPDPNIPSDGQEVPELLALSPAALIERLIQLKSGYRVTLNLSNLHVEDVLEILYECKGKITRLEIFNLKDYKAGNTDHIPAINELQRAINGGNVITLKRVIRDVIARMQVSERADSTERVEKLTQILHDISSLKVMYAQRSLKSRIASDSTGRTARMYGMGMVVKETLPRRAQKEIDKTKDALREVLPIHITSYLHSKRFPRVSPNPYLNQIFRRVRGVPGLRLAGYKGQEEWVSEEDSTRMQNPGNVVTLGGLQKESYNGFALEPVSPGKPGAEVAWKYLNSRLKQILKVGIGFIPAFATFALTKDWWFLAYFGAFLWFGITGLRNILQSVLGGGGFRRSPLMRWNDYVSWERLADSLFFTGFSVPLLDYLVKTVILDRGLAINTSTSPLELYSFMALANGIYLSSHNAYRGLPRGAVWGNFFRSLLSIPIAVGFNAAAGGMMGLAGFSEIDGILQKWAAIISKGASDLVAGFIEGMADRYHNIQMRRRDYRNRFSLMFNSYAELELLFPDAKVLEVLESPEKFMHSNHPGARDVERRIIVCALDLLYFWMYQPRARSALRALLKDLSSEEKQILLRSQFILLRQRTISLLLVDGILGRNFSRALAFYLDRYPNYLRTVSKMREVEIPAEWADATPLRAARRA